MFSRTCQYALQAVIYIALHAQKNKLIGVKEIADSQDIPVHFLSKILQQLVRKKILSSVKGRNGGFKLNQPADQLYLLRIVEVIDGFDVFDLCGLGMKVCSDLTPCPIHHEYQVVKNKVRELLLEKTVVELSQDVKDGKSIVSYVDKSVDNGLTMV